ncbi:uncharacterized protein LOC132715013 [Ruditapes philippinarum]|uniref:uncharacterized protein LOC132715013 n=1 Tax=Ruditapes philippinarum TaxID=129788 RepID=UPI00295BE5A7|nr:uncharacterized protein LOC132715013 [Ruditapes philippinarum]
MLTFTLLTVFAVLLVSVDVVHGISSSACYGTHPCDFFSMQCPSNQVIKLNNLYAGYKNTTINPICGNADRHCELEATCCSYASGGNDILELLTLENIYHTYTNCSGRQSCTDIQANWQLLEATDNNGDLIYSSFVQLEYDCEDASSKIPFCGGPTGTNTGIYSYAEIMFDRINSLSYMRNIFEPVHRLRTHSKLA